MMKPLTNMRTGKAGITSVNHCPSKMWPATAAAAAAAVFDAIGGLTSAVTAMNTVTPRNNTQLCHIELNPLMFCTVLQVHILRTFCLFDL